MIVGAHSKLRTCQAAIIFGQLQGHGRDTVSRDQSVYNFVYATVCATVCATGTWAQAGPSEKLEYSTAVITAAAVC